MSGAIVSGIGAALGFATLHYLHENILSPQGLGCLCPPLGAVAVLLFSMPGAPASQPKAVIGGHIVAGLVAYSVGQAQLPYPEAVSVAVTIVAMSLLKVTHPPAGAYAFLFANKGMGVKGIVAPGLIGAVILIVVQQVVKVLTGMVGGGGKKKKE